MKPVIISFDDIPSESYASIIKLNKMGIPVTLFVSIGYTSSPKYLSIEQLKKLALDNEIACHTYDHVDIISHDGSVLDWMTNVDMNKEAILRIFGVNSKSFAYPKGRYTRRYSKRIRKIYNVQRITKQGKNTFYRLSKKKPVHSIPLYGSDPTSIIEMIGQDKGDFVSLYTHDICANPTKFGCTNEAFFEVVEYLILHDYKFCTFNDLYAVNTK
jgi:peptidoglycan/xylan/chitin deacetylase (PgdA/CDA1 family)